MNLKRCNKCKQNLSAIQFYKDKNRKDGLNGSCKTCYDLRIKNWRAKNKEKRKAWRKKWRDENNDKVNKLSRKYQREEAAELKDNYIRKKLSHGIIGLSTNDIPDELVEAKRLEIQLERVIKKKKNEIQQQGSFRAFVR